MNTKFILLTGASIITVYSSVATAENKFLAQAADKTLATVSCSAPAGMIAIASNILPKDAYLARTGPSVDSDYRFSYYGLEARAFLTQDFMITTDPDAAEVCSQLDQGNVTPEIQQAFEDAIQSDLLWWPVEADKDLGYDPEFPDADEVRVTGYISAKHISFVTSEEWSVKTAPNALGYVDLGGKTLAVPVPILSITGIDTDIATAVVTANTSYTKAALDYCISGYARSDLYWAFNPADVGESYKPVTLPANQTEISIENGIWTGCRIHDENELEDFLGLDFGATFDVIANCSAKTIEGVEIDARYLPESYGAAGGFGTNFATLCPVMTAQILQADCDTGNEYSCESLTEFIER